MRSALPRHLLITGAAALILTLVVGCGSSDEGGAGGGRASIVVTTSILGDVVENLVGDAADVTVIMPAGASPHDFEASARQAVAMSEADLLITNGLGFEEGLLKTVEAAERAGAEHYEASEDIEVLAVGAGAPDEHDEADENDEADDHGAGSEDPHWFTDPARMAVAAKGIAEKLRDEVPALDTASLRQRTDAYVAELEAADAVIEETLAAVPAGERKLVTNHEVFGYFAARYGFEVVGAVIPTSSTQSEPSARDLEALVATIRAEAVPAIFADTSSPTALADKLATGEGLDVEVVELYSESLGPVGSDGDTYIKMMTTDAERIVAALTGR